jgi:nucleoporin NUP159
VPLPVTQDSTPRPSPTPPPLSRGSSTEKEKETTPTLQSTTPPASANTKSNGSETTTPPGSPEKKEPSPPSSSAFAPRVSPATSGSSSSSSPSPPSALGLGRPASRPLRSSPLAGTPVVLEPAKPTVLTTSITQGPPVVKPRPASPKSPFGQLPPTFKAEPTAPVPTKAPETSAFKFGMQASSIFSQPQQGVTPVKTPPSAGSPSPTKTSSPVFLQPASVPVRSSQTFGTPSPTGMTTPGAFSAFKYPATPQQPPMMSAAAQSLTSPSAPFIFPGAAPVQNHAAPTTPVQQGVGNFGVRVTPPGAWGAPGQQTTSPQSSQAMPFQTPSMPARVTQPVQMQFENELQKSCYDLYMHMCNELIEVRPCHNERCRTLADSVILAAKVRAASRIDARAKTKFDGDSAYPFRCQCRVARAPCYGL